MVGIAYLIIGLLRWTPCWRRGPLMKRTFAAILLALVISTVAWTAVHEGGRRTCFTPGDDCTAFLIGRIARARSEL